VATDGDAEEVLEETLELDSAYATLLSPEEAVAAMHLRVPARGNRKLRRLLEKVEGDAQIKAWWHVANVNAVVRLEINDHSWVHIQIVTNIALKLLRQLTKNGVQPSLVGDYRLTVEDSEIVVVLASLLHDVGMSVHRRDHEDWSLFLAEPKLRELLADLYEEPDRTVIVSEVLQAITSHRADGEPLSLEAGVLRVADALDMAKGRSRIPRLRLDPLALGGRDRRGAHRRRPDPAGDGGDRHEQLLGHLPGGRPAEGEAARLRARAVRGGRRTNRHRRGEAPRARLPPRDRRGIGRLTSGR
jgi:uncharacterized protein